MNRDYRDFCTICGYYYVGLANDCKCTGDERGGLVSEYEGPLTEMLRNTGRWFKESWRFLTWKSIDLYFDLSDPLDVGGKYAKTPCAICGKKGEEHTNIGNYKPEGYKPFYMIRIWRWLKVERTITRWEYWMMGIGSGITASALTTFVHWLGS
jgi:hypothetical protein